MGQRFCNDLALDERSRGNYGICPAHNFVAHLSGWVRLKHGAMAWAFFAPELGNWVSGWESRKMVGEKHKRTKKYLIMEFSIVEIVPTSDDNIFVMILP